MGGNIRFEAAGLDFGNERVHQLQRMLPHKHILYKSIALTYFTLRHVDTTTDIYWTSDTINYVRP